MPTTVLVEPDLTGHRFQAVANVALGPSRMATMSCCSPRRERSPAMPSRSTSPTYRSRPWRCSTSIYPPTASMVGRVVARCREDDVRTVVVMDADQTLKKWWLLAPRAFRGLRQAPEVVFFFTRYPARVPLNDPVQVKLRVTKAWLTVVTMLTRTLHRAAGFAGRDDLHKGWLVKRARDPEICGSHSRDRAALRDRAEASPGPAPRRHLRPDLERKNARLVFEGLLAGGIDADLLLAGASSRRSRPGSTSLPAGAVTRVPHLPRLPRQHPARQADRRRRRGADRAHQQRAERHHGQGAGCGRARRLRRLHGARTGSCAQPTEASWPSSSRGAWPPRSKGLRQAGRWPRRSSVPPATAEEFATVVLGR